MNRTRKIFVALAVILVSWLGYWQYFSEPYFSGYPYSYWMKEYCLRDWRTQTALPRTIGAWRGMGPKGVDYLTSLVTGTKTDRAFNRIEAQAQKELYGSLWNRAYKDFLNRASNIKTDERPPFFDRDRVQHEAGSLLIDMRVQAEQLLPAFSSVLNGTNAHLRCLALAVLAASEGGERLEPLLLQALAAEDQSGRARIVEGAMEGLSYGTKWSPAMLKAVEQQARENYFAGGRINLMLGASRNGGARIAPISTNAIPTLVQFMKSDESLPARLFWAGVIASLDSTQQDAVAVLIQCLSVPGHQSEAAYIVDENGIKRPSQ